MTIDIGYNLKVPCSDCPFKKSTALHSGVMNSLSDYKGFLKEGSFGHSCHKTDPRSDGYTDEYKGQIQHCAGALSMMKSMEELDGEKEGKYPSLQSGLIHGLIRKKLDYDDIPSAAECDVFATFDEMEEAYKDMKMEQDMGLRVHILKRGKDDSILSDL